MEHLLEQLFVWWIHLWPHLLTVAILAIDLILSAHAILTKRDTRSTIGWVGLIWFSPVFGAVAYTLLGVNRIRSRANRLRAGTARVEQLCFGRTFVDERRNPADECAQPVRPQGLSHRMIRR